MSQEARATNPWKGRNAFVGLIWLRRRRDGETGEVSSTYLGSCQEAMPATSIFMTESLFTAPETFDGKVLENAIAESTDPEIIYVSGDMPEDVVLSEDEAVAILANYGQVRQYLHQKRLGRGYFQPVERGQKGDSGKKGIGKSCPKGDAQPKRWPKKNSHEPFQMRKMWKIKTLGS